MPFVASAPSDDEIKAHLSRLRRAPFSYRDVGLTQREPARAPKGFVLDDYGTELGRGCDVFERAKQALRDFAHYPPSFTRVVALDPVLQAGSLFATVAQHLGFASFHPCRVIYVIDESDGFGFGFGTLPGHSEAGEERFLVRRDPYQRVSYDVRAFSRPAGLITRLGAPVARRLQLRFQRETLAEMRRLSR